MENNKEVSEKKQCDIHVVSSSYRKCKSCNDKVKVNREEANLIDAGTMLCTCEKAKCLDFGLIELGWPLGFGSN